MKGNKIVFFISGTSRGIGKAIAVFFLEKGHKVIGCSRSKSTIDHEFYHHYNTDLSSELEIMSMIKSIRKHHNSIDVLINNAAINPAIASLNFISYKNIEKSFQINVFAPLLLMREFVKLMLRKKSGRIINIGSMATKHEVKGEALYTSTKASLNALTRVVAKEVNSLGITVNTVAPAAVKTDLSDKINSKELAKILNQNAINSFGTFDQITSIINYLIQEDSAGITGQIIYLGGV